MASLVAGIELRDRMPDCRIELITDAEPDHLGGQVASWDENGYPIEHGLHALFGFYDEILPLLRRVGALDNFTRSPKYVNVFERGGVHRFRPKSWLATYSGFSLREKLGLARCLPALRRFVAAVKRDDTDAFDAYDRYDLREFLGKQGVPDSMLCSSFVRSLYDAPFNNPYSMSAAMGLQSLHRIFEKPWHYHFNLPARVALVDPLRRYFLESCGGTIRYRTRLERVIVDPRSGRVSALEVRNRDGGTERVTGDEFVIALGIESFKRLDLGALWSDPYFANVKRLEGVSSLSLQAWFRQEPTPKQIDTLLLGLPEPLSILSPLSHVRKTGPSGTRLPFELIATGAEGNFASVDDDRIARDFFGTLRSLGFRIPAGWRLGQETEDCYVILRRNRSAADRYLLTRPGHLALRPPVQSPVPNLQIAGAWTRNSLALPCVNSAAESGRVAAETIASRARDASSRRPVELREETAERVSPFRGMPRSHPLVLPPPYEYRRVGGSMFLVRAERDVLAEALPDDLRAAPGFARRLLLAVLDNREVACASDPSRSLYRYREVVLAAVVTPRDLRWGARLGLYPLVVYVDDDTALAVGREVYGFAKKMARVDLEPGRVRLTRKGRPEDGGEEGPLIPIDLLDLQWRERAGIATGGAGARRALNRLLSLGIFNELALPPTAGVAGTAGRPAVLTWVKPSGVRTEGLRWLSGARLRVGTSTLDPIWRLVGRRPRVSPGLAADFCFTIGEGELLEKSA